MFVWKLKKLSKDSRMYTTNPIGIVEKKFKGEFRSGDVANIVACVREYESID